MNKTPQGVLIIEDDPEIQRLKLKWSQGALPIYKARFEEGQRASRIGDITQGKLIAAFR